jgi:hypothetical protein
MAFYKPDQSGWPSNEFQENVGTDAMKGGRAILSVFDLRSTYATRLSAGGVADEWVRQLRRQSDAKLFEKYSQMKLQMKREALARLNRAANELGSFDTAVQAEKWTDPQP